MTELERERAIRGLREQYARGDLTISDLDARVTALLDSQSTAELADQALTTIRGTETAIDRSMAAPESIVVGYLAEGERIE